MSQRRPDSRRPKVRASIQRAEAYVFTTSPGMKCPLCQQAVKPGVAHRCEVKHG